MIMGKEPKPSHCGFCVEKALYERLLSWHHLTDQESLECACVRDKSSKSTKKYQASIDSGYFVSGREATLFTTICVILRKSRSKKASQALCVLLLLKSPFGFRVPPGSSTGCGIYTVCESAMLLCFLQLYGSSKHHGTDGRFLTPTFQQVGLIKTPLYGAISFENM